MPQVLRLTVALCCAVSAHLAFAKLPPPSEEAKAKAAEAAAKTEWSNKVASYQLCQAQDRAVASYRAKRQLDAKETPTPAVAAAACTDPGPYAAAPPAAAGLEKAGAHSAPAATAPAPAAAPASASKS